MTTEETVIRNPAADDIPALDLAATFANKFHITMNSETTRIAIGECVAGDTVYHDAIIVPTGEAVTLANTILNLVEVRKRDGS